ncbi:MAG: DegT/DnrJ/EryC1/StrS family aminotransferase [Rhodothermales bacterium]
MEVPFLNLKAQYLAIQEEVQEAIQRVIDKTAFAGGPFVQQFEEAYAAYCQTKHAIGVGSGTSALWLALEGLGIGEGDEVITTPNTFIATAEAISYAGATPVFVDIDEKTYNIDPSLIEEKITARTRAIIPVHLFGQTADLAPILDIARKHGLHVIEDASQAHGALYQGQPAGSIGDVGCFSFYPGKNLGAYGEAGGIVTSNSDLARYIQMVKDHGQSQKYYHDIVGWNDRMDGIQGAVLSVKLKYIDRWNELRRQHAQTYSNLLSDVDGVVLPHVAEYGTHVYHIYAIRVDRRDQVKAEMEKRGVYCGIHYPLPLHLQKAYEDLGHVRGDFPVTERCSDTYLSLPMYPELTHEQIMQVVSVLKASLAAVDGLDIEGDGHASAAAPAYKKTAIIS